MNDQAKRTIRALSFYSLFSGMMFWYGIEQLFLNEISDGMFARGVVVVIFGVTLGLTNLPSGAFSDVWGRLLTLRLAVIFQFIGVIILAFSGSLFQYGVGAVVFALFWSFDLGAREALVYDTLADHKKEKQYEKYMGRLMAYLLVGAAIANFASGWMSEWIGLRGNFFASLIPVALGFVALMFAYEPKQHTAESESIRKQLLKVPGLVSKNHALAVLLLIGVFVFILADIIGEFAQVVILEFTDSAVVLGLLWMVMALIMALGNWFSHKLKSTILLHFTLLTVFLAYFGLRATAVALVPYLLLNGIMEAVLNRNNANVQDHTPQAMRATVMSISSTVSSFAIVPFALIVGASQSESLSEDLLVTMLPLLLINIGLVLFLRFKLNDKTA